MRSRRATEPAPAERAEAQPDPPTLRNRLFALGDGDRDLRLRASVGRPDWPWLIASRILLLPVIAGLAYELIRYAGKHQDNRGAHDAPRAGALAQRLTTREPTDDQVEVSIQALQRVMEKEAGETPEQRKLESRVEVMA